MLLKSKLKGLAVLSGVLACGLAVSAMAWSSIKTWEKDSFQSESYTQVDMAAPPPDLTYDNFWDAGFADYCFAMFDTNGDYKINGTERMAVTEITITDDETIKSLVDINYFPELTKLDVTWCSNLREVDFSSCTKLEYVRLNCCKDASFNTVDLSKCTALETVDISFSSYVSNLILPAAPSKISYLDFCYTNVGLDKFAAYTSLLYLDCSGAQPWAIETPSSLITLYCDDCEKLLTIDVTQSKKLQTLSASENDIDFLNLQSCWDLESLNLNNNYNFPFNRLLNIDCCEKLTELSLEGFRGAALDLSANPNLKYVDLSDCEQLTTLSLPTTSGVNDTLEELLVPNTSLVSLDVSAFQALRRLYCYDNVYMTSLTVGKNNAALEYIKCTGSAIEGYFGLGELTGLKYAHFDSMPNLLGLTGYSMPNLEYVTVMDSPAINHVSFSECPKLSRLFVSWCPSLTYLYVPDCALTELNLATCPKLSTCICRDNEITDLTLPTAADSLVGLNISRNPIASLDVSAYYNLDALECDSTLITSLDVSSNTKLHYLSCCNCNIGSIDLSKNDLLNYIGVSNCGLTSLDVTGKLLLSCLDCGYNDIGSLDLTSDTAITTLYCNQCQLSSLDVSALLNLSYLDCADNNLTTLDISQCTGLSFLNCTGNKITALNIDNNTDLECIMCADNQLSELNLGHRDMLRIVECKGNNLSELDISGCADLCDLVSNFPPVNLGTYYATEYVDSYIIRHALSYDLTTCLTTIKYQVSFDANGGYGTMPAVSVGGGMSYVLPECAFAAPEGMIFAGWDLGAPGTSIVINDVTVVKATWMPAVVTHTVTVTTDGNGTAVASVASGVNGTVVTLGATPNAGYVFKEWQVVSGGVTITNNTFTIGDADVVIKAVFRESTFEDFIERMYVIALNRPSEAEGKAFWMDKVMNEGFTGGRVAIGFLIEAPEFLNRGLTDEQFVDVLYRTFFDREADEGGKSFWMGHLATDMTREQVVRGFIDSTEWCNLCASYGIKSGAPNAKAEKPSANALKFATRLYTECLGRPADEDGLMFWALRLTNLESSGYEAAKGFFESQEFQNKNVDDETYVKLLYRTFMGRDYDQGGLEFWLGHLSTDMNRLQVLQGFAQSQEFTNICREYGIDRGTI